METSVKLSARSLHYYVLSRRWESDLEFFKIETAFLHRLLNDYFVRLLNPAHFEKLKQTGSKLLELEKNEDGLRQQLSDHLKQLELVAENIVPEDIGSLADTNARIESLVNKMVHEYRELKKELFTLVESAMNEKKLLAE